MATASWGTYDVGSFGYGYAASAQLNHEDFIDVQVILGATQTPAFTSFRKDRARDVVHSWSVDALAATSTAGSEEGKTFASAALTNAKRLTNNTQIFSKGVAVSDRERELNPAGGFKDLLDKEVMKAFKEITRNAEARIFATASAGGAGAAAASATGISGTAPIMASIQGLGCKTSAATGSGVALDDIFRMSQFLFEQGMEPDSIWFAPKHKIDFFNLVSAANTISVRNIAAMDNRLQANIDVMESPFGQLFAIIVDRFIPTTTASNASGGASYYIADRSMAALPFLRYPQMKEMGKNGDYTEALVLMEHTLRLDHPSAWGAVTGLTAT